MMYFLTTKIPLRPIAQQLIRMLIRLTPGRHRAYSKTSRLCQQEQEQEQEQNPSIWQLQNVHGMAWDRRNHTYTFKRLTAEKLIFDIDL